MTGGWWSLAAREWQRRPVRSAVAAGGVGLSVAAGASTMAFHRGYQRALETELGRLGAHVLVVPKGCPYDAASIALHGASWPCYLRESHLAGVVSVAGVETAAPALMLARTTADGPSEVVVGITGEFRRLKPAWKLEGRFPEQDGELLAGAEVVRRQGWRLGDRVELALAPGKRWLVVGTLAPTGGADDGFVHVPLAAAQRSMGKPGQLTHILVRLRRPEELETTVRQLRGCEAGMDMNVVPLAHLFRTIRNIADSTRGWLAAAATLSGMAGMAGVANAMLMAVSERTREIGVLRATGASRGQVFGLVLMEAFQVGGAGACAGLGVAIAGSGVVEGWVRSRLAFAPHEPLVHNDVWGSAALVAGVTLLAGMASVLAASRAARLSPTMAMRDAEARR